VRVSVTGSGSIEEIMICNDVFCAGCSILFGKPVPRDPDFNMYDLPLIHTRFLDTANMCLKNLVGHSDPRFEKGGISDLTTVLHGSVRRAEAVEVMFSDGFQRAVAVCDPEQCQECKAVEGSG
jgi:hypothetical protein